MGGTWLALNGRGKFAVLLNIFEPISRPNAKSRGQLVENFVKGHTSAPEYLQGLQDVYNGFKLITITIRSVLVIFNKMYKIMYLCYKITYLIIIYLLHTK